MEAGLVNSADRGARADQGRRTLKRCGVAPQEPGRPLKVARRSPKALMAVLRPGLERPPKPLI